MSFLIIFNKARKKLMKYFNIDKIIVYNEILKINRICIFYAIFIKSKKTLQVFHFIFFYTKICKIIDIIELYDLCLKEFYIFFLFYMVYILLKHYTI